MARIQVTNNIENNTSNLLKTTMTSYWGHCKLESLSLVQELCIVKYIIVFKIEFKIKKEMQVGVLFDDDSFTHSLNKTNTNSAFD